jgi:hypothetical protein
VVGEFTGSPSVVGDCGADMYRSDPMKTKLNGHVNVVFGPGGGQPLLQNLATAAF